MKEELKFTVSVGQRYMMLICTWIMCYLIGALIMGILFYNGLTPVKVRIGMIVQDLVMFVVPAVVTAVIISRRPADFLMLRKMPSAIDIAIVALLLLISVPAMNVVISWNQSLTLPEQLSGLQEWMIKSEKSASAMLEMVTGTKTVGGLIMCVLLVGILAGFSEELFFRGALQRVLVTTPINRHVAVWLSAIIFSAVHLQFFGFFPRLLLGALFGYLAVWSGSIWLPVIAHILNNSFATIIMWLNLRTNKAVDIDSIGQAGTNGDIAIIAGSAILSAIWLYVLYRRLSRQR